MNTNTNTTQGANDMNTVNNNEWGVSIIIGDNSHVWVARHVLAQGNLFHMSDARIIRQWGTDKGLNQLIDGPTKATVLDVKAPVVSLLAHACLAIIPCRDANWLAHL